MTNEHIKVTPVSGALGAEIEGVDLASLDDESFAEIHAAFLEHLVLFFREQSLTPDQQVAFSKRFGPIGYYPFVTAIPGHPEVIEVRKEADETVNFGGVWHTDTAYLAKPPMGSTLYARDVPPAGGDTVFANMYMAYESLSEGMKSILGGFKAVNSSEKGAAAAGRAVRLADIGKDPEDVQTVSIHPVIRTHPETGRKSLYVNRGHTIRFEGMTEAESAPILDYLFDHQIRPEFTCRHRWEKGALAVWDNRCTLHNALNDYHGHFRLLHRVTLEGETPV